MTFAERTVVVSGGASGLGAAVVERVVHDGGHAVLIDHDEAGATALAARLGSRAHVYQADTTSAQQIEATFSSITQRFGRIDVAVCTAGIAPAERVLPRGGIHSLQAFAHVVDVNLSGTFNVVRMAAAAMATNTPSAEGERGVIVMTASVAAFEGQIGQAAYAASKGGVIAMTLPLARELARLGIRVVTIAPGTFDTPLLAGLPDTTRASLGQQVPFPPRLGRPAEFAALVEHIVSNTMLNGETIRLDGAIRMAAK